MAHPSITSKTACIVGLGYVGYPLAEAFSHRFYMTGESFSKGVADVPQADNTDGFAGYRRMCHVLFPRCFSIPKEDGSG